MSDWLLLREAAKESRLARGWIEMMARRGIIESRFIPDTGQLEVCQKCVESHKREIGHIRALDLRLLLLLDGQWIQYKEIRAAIPGATTDKLKTELQLLADNGMIERDVYTCRGKKGKRYRVIHDTIDK